MAILEDFASIIDDVRLDLKERSECGVSCLVARAEMCKTCIHFSGWSIMLNTSNLVKRNRQPLLAKVWTDLVGKYAGCMNPSVKRGVTNLLKDFSWPNYPSGRGRALVNVPRIVDHEQITPKSLNQWINQPISRSIFQSINQSISQWIIQSINYSTWTYSNDLSWFAASRSNISWIPQLIHMNNKISEKMLWHVFGSCSMLAASFTLQYSR